MILFLGGLTLLGVGYFTYGRLWAAATDCGLLLAVFRDTGDMGDFTDGDAPVSSLRTFVIAGLVWVVQGRQHLNTIGCNRTMFTFTPDPISVVTHTPRERTRQSCN